MIPSSPLAPWQSFYVLVGTAAAALTGLQFIALAFMGQYGARVNESGINAYATPTIVHFCISILLSALLSAPWGSLAQAGAVVLVFGVVALAYAGVVFRRMRRRAEYTPVFEDWLWHSILPVSGYLALVVGAVLALGGSPAALYVMGAVSLLVLFIGIHNAWDLVTFIALTHGRMGAAPRAGESGEAPEAAAPPREEAAR